MKDERGRFRKGEHPSPATEFKKGHIPFNKGMKQSEYMSQEVIEKTRLTQFKKGSTPPRYREIGSTRICRDGYREVKTGRDEWKREHNVVWEREHGAIPKGYTVIHLNCDKLDNDINNLHLVSMPVLAVMNRLRMFSTDRDVTLTAIHIAELKLAINKKAKKKKENV